MGYFEETSRRCNFIDCRLIRWRKKTCIIIPIALCSIIAFLVLRPIIQKSRNITNERNITNSMGVAEHPDVVTRIKRDKAKALPQALIIGTRKSGTRALLRFLEINPTIRSAHREVHFFDKDVNYYLGLEWYRSQMPETSLDEITIEKSPAYFVTRDAPERIKAMNASIKLILILRNPVTRLVSDFSQTIANRIEDPSSLEDYYDHDHSRLAHAKSGPSERTDNATKIWVEAAKELESHVLRHDGRVDDQRRIVRIGMYSLHLERWLSIFPRDQFHFVDGEKLIEKPHEELRKLERFLGLSPVIQQEHFVFSPKKGFYCMAKQTMLSDSPRKDQMKEQNTSGLTCLGKSKGRRHVAMSQELLDRLRSFYAPYNEYLESMTGLNFNV